MLSLYGDSGLYMIPIIYKKSEQIYNRLSRIWFSEQAHLWMSRILALILVVSFIFSVLILLISIRNSPDYHSMYKYSGYILGTILIRVALLAEPLWNVVIGIISTFYVIFLTWTYKNMLHVICLKNRPVLLLSQNKKIQTL